MLGLANIHVSVSGKISLIDFGLSDCSNNEEHKENDFETLEYILRIHGSIENDSQVNQDSRENEVIHDKPRNDGNDRSDSNSSAEEIFDGMSAQSFDTSTTKEVNSSNPSQR